MSSGKAGQFVVEKKTLPWRMALAKNAADARAWYELGVVAYQMADSRLAIAYLQQALALDRTLPWAWFKLGLVLEETNQWSQAINCYQQALRYYPNYVEPLFRIGVLFYKVGRVDEAQQSFDHLLATAPDHAGAHRYMGLLQKRQGDVDGAVVSFRRAIKIAPDYADAYNNLGTTLGEQGDLAGALMHFQRATQLKPDFPQAHYNLGVVLEMRHDVAGASASYARAADLEPGKHSWKLKKALLIPPLAASEEEIVQCRQKFETVINNCLPGSIDLADQSLQNLSNSSLQPSLVLAYHGRNDRPLKEQYARLFTVSETDPPPRTRDVCVDGRYRIGFLVTRGHERGFNTFVAGLVNHLDHATFQAVIICPKVSLERVKPAIRLAGAEYLVIHDRAREAAVQIKQAGLQLLYYWEVGTDPLNYYLPFFRPAPVQCTSWGTPTTTGIPTMDYFISSTLLENETAEPHYSETLIKFQSLGMYCERPQINNLQKDRSDFGFNEAVNLYLCTQNLQKFHPDFDELIFRILRQDAKGRLLVKAKQQHLNQALLRRWQQRIPDVTDRITLVPYQSYNDYLNLVKVVDVLLDTIHYSGGTTSYEAIAVGTPIVTWPGEFMRGRMTHGCYQKINVLDTVVWSAQAYISKAIRLANDKAYQAQVRGKILAAGDILFEDMAAARELEQFFEWAILKNRREEATL